MSASAPPTSTSSPALRSARACGAAWLGGRAGVSGLRGLREKSETSGAGRAHRGCTAEEVLRRARRCVRPSREERQAFPASHGRVRQSGHRLHLPARKHRHQRSDGTTLPDADWLDCRTRIGLDPRTRAGWHAKGEAGRGANRTRTDEHRSSSHCPRPTQRNDVDRRLQEVGHFPQSRLQAGKEITGW